MSSMVRSSALLLLLSLATISAPARCQDGSEWDRARARLTTSPSGMASYAIGRWQMLSGSPGYGFSEYAGFLLSYPGYPDEARIRGYAEKALDRETVSAAQLVAFFDRFAPTSNPARAAYALALAAGGRPEAPAMAVLAWRGGTMSDTALATLQSLYQRRFTASDHDARMDALLWQGNLNQAQQQLPFVSPATRNSFLLRLATLQGPNAYGPAGTLDPNLLRDSGYVYNRVRQLKSQGNYPEAARLLATRPPAINPPLEPEKWIAELLAAARGADAATAVRIAAIDDAFPAGTDVSRQSYRIRDDYTSLMWLGATRALDSGDVQQAAALFQRYGAAARSAQTRAKGYYWAGRALARRQDGGATRYFELAAAYPDQFYGMLALERLGRPLPPLSGAPPLAAITPDQRRAFDSLPLTQAVKEVARGYEWRTSVRFFREIAEDAQTQTDHLLIADLAREIGRRDLAVILGQSLHADGYGDWRSVAFPQMPVPPGTDWTMIHAISRQESQFAQNAISHAGARGLMQLMPGTAREQAGKIGLAYMPESLTSDPAYNVRLGDAYFGRMMDYFGGSYPLAVAAYNAGPGNVNRWLGQNGDPRNGSIDWIDWIERIPLSETRNYVQRVLENAVVYEALNPARARYKGSDPLSHFLGKRYPG